MDAADREAARRATTELDMTYAAVAGVMAKNGRGIYKSARAAAQKPLKRKK